jgi:hypothetical protein
MNLRANWSAITPEDGVGYYRMGITAPNPAAGIVARISDDGVVGDRGV